MSLLKFSGYIGIICSVILLFVAAFTTNALAFFASIYSMLLSASFLSFLADFESLQNKVNNHLQESEHKEQTDEKKEEITTEN